MAKETVSITNFSVGNGNCSIIEDDNFLMIIDLNKNEESETSYDMLKPFFRKKDGKDCIDILCITHGDEDHCLDFKKFRKEIDNGTLIIGSIWHQGYDRTENEKEEDLPEDYLELRKEIKKREESENPEFGDIVEIPNASQTETDLFNGIDKPDELFLKILSPFDGDDASSEYDHNDLCIVFNLDFHGKSLLYAADSSSKYWQNKIIPELLDDSDTKDFAESKVLIVSHHGSYTFFGENRDDVREADPEPDNYEALNRIAPDDLIISAKDKFPTSRDKSGEEPPHYSAYKWYHKWFRDNHSVLDDDKHPESFRYTSESNIRLEYRNNQWKWIEAWEPDSEDDNENLAAAFVIAKKAVSPRPYYSKC